VTPRAAPRRGAAAEAAAAEVAAAGASRPGGPILVVGSVALDSVKTPRGESREALGGSAVYFSLAARLFAPVRVVGVVGTDFPREHRSLLETRGIDVDGLEGVPGRTFRWSGRYGKDGNEARTLETQLNVFASFKPRLGAAQRECPVVFLANIDPELQWEVLSQMSGPALVACDTMNYWIASKKPALKELLSRVDLFFVNEKEARQLTREPNNCRAARTLCEWGPSVVVVKKGEHGALVMAGGTPCGFPAYPVEDVVDPTGAGDSFAGGVMGVLASAPGRPEGLLADAGLVKRAVLYGSVLASFNVQGFGTAGLASLERSAVEDRARDYLERLSVARAEIAARFPRQRTRDSGPGLE
jgi:sugar/nucleoside kinase (ribokinase family)